jgi:hypothetical protein
LSFALSIRVKRSTLPFIRPKRGLLVQALLLAACGPQPAAHPESSKTSSDPPGTPVPLLLVPPGVKDVLNFSEPTCRQLYSQTSDYLLVEVDESAQGRTWKRLATEQDWADYSGTRPTATAGITREEDWVLVSLSRTSSAGEWLEYLDLCFGPEGRLHEAHGRFNTFSSTCAAGGISQESLQTFDASGRRQSVEVDVRHLSTLAPLSCTPVDVAVPDYLQLDSLPFTLP